jgi:hypothetical protein
MITEIAMREGQIEVRRLNLPEWRPVVPLLALNAGDTVRASRDASVVILLSGVRGTVKVDATNSPFQVPKAVPSAEPNTLRRGWLLLKESVRALLKISNDSDQVPLGTRGHASSVAILTPRNGLVLPDSLVFEWAGDQPARHTVRIVGPPGLVLERKDVAGPRFVYPADAVPLIPGVRYQLQVISGVALPEKAWFEVVDPARAEAVRRDLGELAAATGSTVSPNTLVTVQVVYLASQGLFADARLRLITAVDDQPDEATFHYLLGAVYEQLDLPGQAAESFAQARVVGRCRAQR